MILNESVLKQDERVIYELRELYRRHGYSQFKMSKFEEYDLYSKNKDFLVSDSVITFTDTNGRLMALKPDVTLSIIKNAKWQQGCAQRFYYNENVYRISHTTHTFEELMQAGLECIGQIDALQLCEVILLAAQSLDRIHERFVLDISHMAIVSAVVSALALPEEARAMLLVCLEEKNAHGARALCEQHHADADATARLLRLIRTYGTVRETLPSLRELCAGLDTQGAIEELAVIADVLEANGYADRTRLDFSVVHDMQYYSGVVFEGFIEGIPEGVLIGGRYDRLLHKMGKQGGAIGFAVYLDLLERLHREERDCDADILCLYDDSDDPIALTATVARWRAEGKTVLLQRQIPAQMRFGRIVRFGEEAQK